MEMATLYFLTIFLDLFTIIYLEKNREYVFIISSYFIAIIILANTMKARYFVTAISDGRGFIFYDFLVIILYSLIIYGLPSF